MRTRSVIVASMLLLTLGLSACGTPRTNVAGPAYWSPDSPYETQRSGVFPAEYGPED